MTPDEYLEQSSRTDSNMFHPMLVKEKTIHGVIGLAGETGELLDCIKKSLFYGQLLDKVNLKEELGDCLWYISQVLRSEDWTFEEVMKENIDKLKTRYPKRFTTKESINRKDKNVHKTI